MRIAIALGCVVLISFAALPSCKKAKTGRSTFNAYNAAVQKGIKKTIDDKQTKNKLLALHAKGILKSIDSALIFSEAGVQMRKKVDLTPEEAEMILQESARKRMLVLKEISETRREMRKLVTEEEWNRIFVKTAEVTQKEKE